MQGYFAVEGVDGDAHAFLMPEGLMHKLFQLFHVGRRRGERAEGEEGKGQRGQGFFHEGCSSGARFFAGTDGEKRVPPMGRMRTMCSVYQFFSWLNRDSRGVRSGRTFALRFGAACLPFSA